MGQKPTPAIERVLSNISPEPNSGCWLFTAGCNHGGYGRVRDASGRMVKAHRVSYEHFKGPIPLQMFVMHACDVPCCCNPDHLTIGTPKDNTSDMVRKGRHVAGKSRQCGVQNSQSKLTDEAVRHIRQRKMTGVAYANLYGVHPTTISSVLRGQAWAHVHA